MYAPQSLYDILFLMLYGGVAMIAFVAGIYLWLRRSNAIEPSVTPPKLLRRWTAAFFIMAAMSHVWWYVLGVYWLADDRLVRNTLCVMLDHITLVPLVMAVLLRLLQDRQRSIWPWAVSQVLVIGSAAVGIAHHNDGGLDLMHYCQVAILALFVGYYTDALVQYSRWLKENYADLDHKEVWQSLLFVVVLFLIYEVYSTNPGDMPTEYLSQLNTLLIIGFLLWRVETLSSLTLEHEGESVDVSLPVDGSQENRSYEPDLYYIGGLLEQQCEATQLYLQHDLTLQQLASIIGTNRTYLSQYFAQQDITYNVYINHLRVQHFMRLYRDSISSSHPATATELAQQSGFRSYSTFATAFKQVNGQTVTTWMKNL